jgi:hypothetical protein
VLFAPRLHLQKRDEGTHLLLHGLETDQCVELRLHLGEGPRRRRSVQDVRHSIELRAGRLSELLAERADPLADLVEWARHVLSLPRIGARYAC